MRHLNRIVVFLGIVICGVMTSMAQRDIKLKLNKLNFENFDTVKVEASFVGFEDDPVVGDVIADIVNPKDSIIQTVVMHRNADGIYHAELPVPPNEINSLCDVPKLCNAVSFAGNSIYAGGNLVPICSEDLGISAINAAQSYLDFKKVPFSKVTYITVYPRNYMKFKKGIADELYIWVETQRTHPVDNIFRLQVGGILKSGERIVGFKNITLPVIHFTTYRGDPELQRSTNNIFHEKWINNFRY